LKGMRSTGVARDVAADLRLVAGSGIRREEEPISPRELVHS